MILAISLCQCDVASYDEEQSSFDQNIYTNKVAVFEHECIALDFAKGKGHIFLVDCKSGRILKDANVVVTID